MPAPNTLHAPPSLELPPGPAALPGVEGGEGFLPPPEVGEIPGATPEEGPGRFARIAAFAGRIVRRTVEAIPAVAAQIERTGAVDRAMERSRGMSPKAKLAVLAGAHAIRFASGVNQAHELGMHGKKAAAYAGVHSVRRHYAGRHA